MPKKNHSSSPSINPGDAGIWATCDMHKEGLCTVELKDLFSEVRSFTLRSRIPVHYVDTRLQYADLIYGDVVTPIEAITGTTEEASHDIEAEINKEVQGMQKSTYKQEALFVPVKIDVQCGKSVSAFAHPFSMRTEVTNMRS